MLISLYLGSSAKTNKKCGFDNRGEDPGEEPGYEANVLHCTKIQVVDDLPEGKVLLKCYNTNEPSS